MFFLVVQGGGCKFSTGSLHNAEFQWRIFFWLWLQYHFKEGLDSGGSRFGQGASALSPSLVIFLFILLTYK